MGIHQAGQVPRDALTVLAGKRQRPLAAVPRGVFLPFNLHAVRSLFSAVTPCGPATQVSTAAAPQQPGGRPKIQ